MARSIFSLPESPMEILKVRRKRSVRTLSATKKSAKNAA
jgi:hypothetical protein